MRACCGILLVLVLCGCKPDKNLADDYVQRLENVLDVSGKKTDVKAPKFPDPRDLKIELSASELSIREFLSLRECELHTTIARRNSLIGKVAKPSQLLFNNIRILEQGPDCLNTLDNATLSKKLKQFLDKKHSEIGQSLWFALLAQDELSLIHI